MSSSSDTVGIARPPDPRIAAHIERALAGCGPVVNVGAGSGVYEPPSTVLAVEPSAARIARRTAGAATAVRALAEALPLPDKSVDAAMAVLTVHGWADLETGIAEMRRVARKRIVILTWDQRVSREFWLLREYLTMANAYEDRRAVPVDRLAALLGRPEISPVPVPHDCVDGFGLAYWRRPEAYLDPAARSRMSIMAQHPPSVLQPGLERLAFDVASGIWHATHADLLDRTEFDVGYRLLVADVQ